MDTILFFGTFKKVDLYTEKAFVNGYQTFIIKDLQFMIQYTVEETWPIISYGSNAAEGLNLIGEQEIV